MKAMLNNTARLSFTVICSLLLTTLIQTAQADATLTYQSLNGQFNFQLKNQQVYVKNIDQGTDILFDQNANHVIIINHSQQSYSLLNEAEMQNINQQIGGLKDTLTSNLSDDQRSQLNDFLGGVLGTNETQAAPQYTINNIGGAQVGNFQCQQSEVFENNQSLGFICSATAQQLQVIANEYQTLMAFQSFAIKANNLLRESVGSALQVELPNLENTTLNELLIYSKLQGQSDPDFFLEQINTNPINENFILPNNYQRQSLLSSISIQ